MYRAGRKKFLQQALQADFIFHTTVFRDHFEARARQNMERELALL
jgi:predicted metal-dependent HD superfamily phosphohydrolase